MASQSHTTPVSNASSATPVLVLFATAAAGLTFHLFHSVYQLPVVPNVPYFAASVLVIVAVLSTALVTVQHSTYTQLVMQQSGSGRRVSTGAGTGTQRRAGNGSRRTISRPTVIANGSSPVCC